jgi:hypothetical protein
MRYGLILCFLACALGSAFAQTTVTIKSVSPAAFGFNVTVEVTNVGTRPIVVQLSPNPAAGHPRLQSLTVEQWDTNLGWQRVGPCKDIEGQRTRTLSQHQAMQDVVPIGDVAHGWSNAPCPRKIQHLGGKIRAVLACTYDSEGEFKRRRGIEQCQLVESPPVELPNWHSPD